MPATGQYTTTKAWEREGGRRHLRASECVLRGAVNRETRHGTCNKSCKECRKDLLSPAISTFDKAAVMDLYPGLNR